jgi:lysozyme
MNTLSADGEALIKAFEKLALIAYLDEGDVWTLGWGHAEGVKQGDTCTADEAERWLDADIATLVSVLNTLIHTNVTQNQFDALVSFTYNVGVGAERHSTLLKLINERLFDAAALEFSRWVHVKGNVSQGLVRRRQAEQALFDGHDWRAFTD